MQANTASGANRTVNFHNFSVEKRDPFSVRDGRFVGHDGFVVPKDFDEFYYRFPDYVRNWVRRHAGASASREDVEDWTQDLSIHLRYLPPNSKHREAGKEDVIQTFDPVKHFGANQARFQNYLNLCLANKFRTLRSMHMKDALSRPGNMSLDTQREWNDRGAVDDGFCHLHSVHLQRAANASRKQDQDRALTSEFSDFVQREDPNLLRAVGALYLSQTHGAAAISLGMTEAQFNRTHNRLLQLGSCFLSGEPVPRQRKPYKKRVKPNRKRFRRFTLLCMEPETWNREELYEDVWKQPLTKLQTKYRVSNVAIGKACRKLKVPLPGRGYWAKLAAGHKLKQVPLPELKTAPVVYRMKTEATPKPTVDSSDPELAKIAEVASHPIGLRNEQHKLVASSAGLLRRARTDEYGRIEPPSERPCVDVRVSKEVLDRALALMSTIVFALEENGFEVKVEQGSTSAQIFGQGVKFGIVEDLRVKERRKEPTYNDRIKTVNVYERNGTLAFEISEYTPEKCRKRWADGKTQRAEEMLPQCVAGLMLVARTVRIWQEELKRRHEEYERQARERAEYQRLSEELDKWMAGWQKAKQIREFVAAVEKVCQAKGEPTTPDSPKGKWIEWALRRAEAFDPLVEEKSSK